MKKMSNYLLISFAIFFGFGIMAQDGIFKQIEGLDIDETINNVVIKYQDPVSKEFRCLTDVSEEPHTQRDVSWNKCEDNFATQIWNIRNVENAPADSPGIITPLIIFRLAENNGSMPTGYYKLLGVNDNSALILSDKIFNIATFNYLKNQPENRFGAFWYMTNSGAFQTLLQMKSMGDTPNCIDTDTILIKLSPLNFPKNTTDEEQTLRNARCANLKFEIHS